MPSLIHQVNDLRPFDDKTKIDKLYEILLSRRTYVTPEIDAAICSLINNPEMETYFHEQLNDVKKDIAERVRMEPSSTRKKRKKAGLKLNGALQKHYSNVAKMTPDTIMGIDRDIYRENLRREDFEYGLSDW
jgi:hypothetical protein